MQDLSERGRQMQAYAQFSPQYGPVAANWLRLAGLEAPPPHFAAPEEREACRRNKQPSIRLDRLMVGSRGPDQDPFRDENQELKQ